MPEPTGPLSERIVSKVIKFRESAYIELESLFSNTPQI